MQRTRFETEGQKRFPISRWLRREQPGAVVSTRNHVCGLIRGLGWKIRAQIGFASLAASARDVPHLAGVDERQADVGFSAIDLLFAQLRPAPQRSVVIPSSLLQPIRHRPTFANSPGQF